MENQPVTETINATDGDFKEKVMERSRELPVLVDFWAPWCAPCKVLGPILEKLAGEWAGGFQLVKVDTDQSPMLSQELMLKSIPAVKLIIDGQIQDEFTGALSEPEVRKFLEKNLPKVAGDDAVEALKLWVAGEKLEAVEIFQQVLRGEPGNLAAMIGVGNYLAEQGEFESAGSIMDKIEETELDEHPERALLSKALGKLRARLFLMENAAPDNQGGDGGEEANAGGKAPAGLPERFGAACRLALDESHEEALEELLAIVEADRKFNDDAGRKGMLALFDLLPDDSPLTRSYRFRLSSALFS